MTSSVVALHTDLAKSEPVIVCFAAVTRSRTLCPDILERKITPQMYYSITNSQKLSEMYVITQEQCTLPQCSRFWHRRQSKWPTHYSWRCVITWSLMNWLASWNAGTPTSVFTNFLTSKIAYKTTTIKTLLFQVHNFTHNAIHVTNSLKIPVRFFSFFHLNETCFSHTLRPYFLISIF